jgi:MFS family permease
VSLFSSLRVRNYRLFASGQVVSLTGTWMQRVAQDWLVLNLSHNSGTAVGVTTGLQFAPVLFVGLFGGVIADRYPKRRTLVWSQAAMGLTALWLGLLDLSGSAQLWHVYGLAFLLGCASAIDAPVRQAFVSELVGPSLLANAVSLNSATFNIARVLGPAVAGVMIASSGTSWVFLANAVSFIAVITGLLLMRDGELYVGKRPPREPAAVRAGLRYVRTRPELLLIIVLVGVIGTLGFNFQITTALLAKRTFHRGAESYGLLSAGFAFGALLGALWSARRGAPRQRLVYIAGVVFGLFEITAGLMPTFWTFFLMLIPCGVATLTLSTSSNTSIQLGTSPQMRGRVMSLYLLVFMGGTPIGAPLIGWLATAAGPRWSLIVGGIASTIASVWCGLALARRTNVSVQPHLVRRRPHVHVRPSIADAEDVAVS